MRYRNLTILGLGTCFIMLSTGYASEITGNIENGAKKAPICAACHGIDGQGIANIPNQPKLGGQHPAYIRAQLYELQRSFKDKKNGLRIHNIMGPQAASLSEQDQIDLAAYFNAKQTVYLTPADYAKEKRVNAAEQRQQAVDKSVQADEVAKQAAEALTHDKDNPEFISKSKEATRAARMAKSLVKKADDALKLLEIELKTEQTLLQRGQQLYNGGDLAKALPACTACHGPAGMGNAPAGYPKLAGQHYEYTVNQLNNFKTALRKNDPARMMRDIAERMSEEEIKASAVYIKYLQP